ncbi:hypothetical protein J1N35_013049 [Gossypium stocksii]|uniref:S1 motif domain-containing protein n=1 Tax=Gossypium stocksii TaxID=47602 RepID=A0A9D3VT01_9ROSI|nr:hypothetical protein J1N35_013049 [Gossypium stocksii]
MDQNLSSVASIWSFISPNKTIHQIAKGDVFEGKVGSVEDYGAFVHLRFPDGLYHLTGLVHVSEDGSADSDSLTTSNSSTIEPLPGLDAIFKELLQEDGINDVRISRQGFEKRVVSQDLQLCLLNAPPSDNMFTLLARAGRQVQEIQLATSLDQEGIKKALRRVLERVH